MPLKLSASARPRGWRSRFGFGGWRLIGQISGDADRHSFGGDVFFHQRNSVCFVSDRWLSRQLVKRERPVLIKSHARHDVLSYAIE
jgi:hypothetical protein